MSEKRVANARRQREFNKRLRDKAIMQLGGRCSSSACSWINGDGTRGCTDTRCLQIDHKNGGGTKEHKTLCYNKFLQRVLLDVDNQYQLLCANCNWIKRHTDNEVPNKKDFQK